jgi:hypothetical protein
MKFQIPNSKFQIPASKFKIPNSKFHIPYSSLKIPVALAAVLVLSFFIFNWLKNSGIGTAYATGGTVKVLVVGGGGGGGNSNGGGGGAGGFVYNSAFTVTAQEYPVTVGDGGLGGIYSDGYATYTQATKGQNSVFSTITAEGGGYGRGQTLGVGGDGGSGGGGSGDATAGTPNGGNATSGQGYNGGKGGFRYAGGGGGGAGAVGADVSSGQGGNGGIGLANPIIGSTSGQNVSGTYYFSGGGGGTKGSNGSIYGVGGYGGGAVSSLNTRNDGVANAGGGGGGTYEAVIGMVGTGGSGIVIISWVTADYGTCTVSGAGNTITTSGENSIATFITSGNFTVVAAAEPPPSGEGWLAGYSARKKVTIAHQTGAGTNYQVKLLVGKTSGATGEDFDLEGNCLDSMFDMRFTDNDGATPIDYWIESVAVSGTSYLATVWVEVADSLESSDADIYCYYGKAGDTDGSSGPNTFIQYHGAASSAFEDSNIIPPNNIAFESKFRRTSVTHNLGVQLWSTAADSQLCFQSYSGGASRYAYTRSRGTGTQISEASEFPLNTYVRLLMTSLPTEAHFYVDGDEIASGSTTNLPIDNLGLDLWIANGTCDQEFSFARKYVATEPAYSLAGAEEAEAAEPESSVFTISKSDSCSCASNSECYSGFCSQGVCSPSKPFAIKKSNSCSCTDSEQCYSGNCDAGVCASLGPIAVNLTPPADNSDNYCGDSASMSVFFEWLYQEPDNLPLSSYQFRVNTIDDVNAANPAVDLSVGSRSDPAESTITQAVGISGSLAYDSTYYWWVKVCNQSAVCSNWISGPSFSTPNNHYPITRVAWDKKTISVGDTIQFCSTADVASSSDPCYSVCWKGSTAPVVDPGNADWTCSVCSNSSNEYRACQEVGSSYSWDLLDMTEGVDYEFVSSTAASSNPQIKFLTAGQSRGIGLNITAGSYSCVGGESLNANLPIPNWKEVSPF